MAQASPADISSLWAISQLAEWLVNFMRVSIFLYIELQHTLANLLAYDLVDVTQERDLILHALPLLAFLIE